MDISSLLIVLLVIVGFILLIIVLSSNFTIADDEVGIIVKKSGRSLAPGRLIALNGEAGVQAEVLPPNRYLRIRYPSFIYEIRRAPLVRISPGSIGIVQARDGQQVPPGRVFGRCVPECLNYQDARDFLSTNDKNEIGGQKGRQLGILTPGDYRINLELFSVMTYKGSGQSSSKKSTDDIVVRRKYRYGETYLANGLVIYGKDIASDWGVIESQLRVVTIDPDRIGLVTVQDGALPPFDNAIGHIVADHKSFQAPQVFLDKGGCKGSQLEVLPPGEYYLNPWFVKIQPVPTPLVPDETVGVVSYQFGTIAEKHTDQELVDKWQRGIWRDPLPPGRYLVNRDVWKIHVVPTNEIVLIWSDQSKKDTDRYDYELKRFEAYTCADGNEISFDVSLKIMISAHNAPTMISKIRAFTREESNVSTIKDAKNIRWESIKQLVMRELKGTIEGRLEVSLRKKKATQFMDELAEIIDDVKQDITEDLGALGVECHELQITDLIFPPSIRKDRAEHEDINRRIGIFADRTDEQEAIRTFEVAKRSADLERVRFDAEKKRIDQTLLNEAAIAKLERDREAAELAHKIEIDRISRETQAAKDFLEIERQRDIQDAEVSDRDAERQRKTLEDKVRTLGPDLYREWLRYRAFGKISTSSKGGTSNILEMIFMSNLLQLNSPQGNSVSKQSSDDQMNYFMEALIRNVKDSDKPEQLLQALRDRFGSVSEEPELPRNEPSAQQDLDGRD